MDIEIVNVSCDKKRKVILISLSSFILVLLREDSETQKMIIWK